MGRLPISIVLLIPPPDGPTACPDGDTGHRTRRTKAAPQEAQDGPGTSPQLLGGLGPIGGNSIQRGHRRPRLFLVFQGLRDPWQAGFVRTNPMLAETKTRRCIRSRHPEDLMQIRNRLRIYSCPAHALPVLLIPPPGGPTACPDGEADPQAQGNKSGPAGSAGQPRDHPPAPGEPGTHWGNTATRGPQTAPQQLPASPCIRSRTALEILPNPQASAVLVLQMTAPLSLLCRTFVAPQSKTL